MAAARHPITSSAHPHACAMRSKSAPALPEEPTDAATFATHLEESVARQVACATRSLAASASPPRSQAPAVEAAPRLMDTHARMAASATTRSTAPASMLHRQRLRRPPRRLDLQQRPPPPSHPPQHRRQPSRRPRQPPHRRFHRPPRPRPRLRGRSARHRLPSPPITRRAPSRSSSAPWMATSCPRGALLMEATKGVLRPSMSTVAQPRVTSSRTAMAY